MRMRLGKLPLRLEKAYDELYDSSRELHQVGNVFAAASQDRRAARCLVAESA
jgi:hypothetical protein